MKRIIFIMNKSYITVMAALFLFGAVLQADNIDPYEIGKKYAYSENTGWLNFDPAEGGGVQVSSTAVTGYVWAENIGWVNLSPANYGGVVNDGSGSLSGYAWGENVGWINFDPKVAGDSSDYGVAIDTDGYFNGWAYGENIGWVRFDNAQSWSPQVCTVGLEDLQNFVDYWLSPGISPANLNGDGNVDVRDFSILASYWLGYCPDNWNLK